MNKDLGKGLRVALRTTRVYKSYAGLFVITISASKFIHQRLRMSRYLAAYDLYTDRCGQVPKKVAVNN